MLPSASHVVRESRVATARRESGWGPRTVPGKKKRQHVVRRGLPELWLVGQDGERPGDGAPASDKGRGSGCLGLMPCLPRPQGRASKGRTAARPRHFPAAGVISRGLPRIMG